MSMFEPGNRALPQLPDGRSLARVFATMFGASTADAPALASVTFLEQEPDLVAEAGRGRG